MALDFISNYADKTVLAIGAHPDDIELGAGGTIARLTRVGARVVHLIVSIPSHRERRIDEARRAAEVLGSEARFVRPEACCRVEDFKSYELLDAITGAVRELKPALVLSHGPQNFHRDHVLVYNACVGAQDAAYFDLLCYFPTSTRPTPAPFNPQAYVDITPTIEQKMRAIHIHHSQFGENGGDYYRQIARKHGRMAGVDYAEGLEVVRLRMN